jgi:hypothetical protein
MTSEVDQHGAQPARLERSADRQHLALAPADAVEHQGGASGGPLGIEDPGLEVRIRWADLHPNRL